MKWESIYIQEEYENIDSLIMLSGRGKKIQLCIINFIIPNSLNPVISFMKWFAQFVIMLETCEV